MIISDWSSDLCSSHLYSCPQTFSRTAPRVAIRSKAHMSSTAISELLHGEMFQAIDIAGGWAWGYCVHDHYVGYIPVDTLRSEERREGKECASQGRYRRSPNHKKKKNDTDYIYRTSQKTT